MIKLRISQRVALYKKMNRAFVRENDLEHAGIDIPERPLSDEPNYVTPRGLSLLHQTIDDLEKERETLNAKKMIRW